MEWIVQLPILFFSIIIHEITHGWIAYLKGDDTAARAGRLTLNPAAHIDPFGSIILPALCVLTRMPMFGWAKPVPVSAGRLNNPRWDMMQVAAFGPLSNITLALAFAVLFKLTAMSPLAAGFQRTIMDALIFGVSINLFLAFFNLLPVHPLDGSQVMSSLLPFDLRQQYERHFPYGMWIIIGLMFTRLLYPLVMVPAQMTMNLFGRMGLLW